MLRDLNVCKAVVLDVSAPQVIVEAFINHFELGSKPLILVASECGTNDRKKDLALRVIEESGPNFITGKLVDIFTLSGARNEKCKYRSMQALLNLLDYCMLLLNGCMYKY